MAEGLTAEVAAREGGISDDALATIRAQFDALSYLAVAAREGQALTLHFVRELHQLITRHQLTYEARNSLGQVLQVPFHHGVWKDHPNHVHRSDGRLLEYVPPEQVQPQMERLVEFYAETERAHPIVRAAWLHHAFIRIHPFEDGNGRVARALTLLALLQRNYAPLVVDRITRADYISALDDANDGDLRGLVRLFARLEIAALRSELERPVRPEAVTSGAVSVAKSYVERLRALHEAKNQQKLAATEALAAELHGRITEYLDQLGKELLAQFAPLDPHAQAATFSASPPAPEARWWRAQIIRAANQADFFTNLTQGVWWSHLRLIVQGQTLRYVAVVQKVGRGETGVLALTIFAEAVPSTAPDSEQQGPQFIRLLHATEAETATFTYTEALDARWSEVGQLIDRTLAASIARFAEGLG